jgi:hypothetical protein
LTIELLPTWSATPKEKGGLGFDSREIGIILSFAGLVMLFIQIFVLHRLTQQFGLLVLFQFSLLLSAIVFFAQGLCRLLDTPYVGVLICITLKSISQTIAITTAVILLNNCVTKSLGFINGFSQCK